MQHNFIPLLLFRLMVMVMVMVMVGFDCLWTGTVSLGLLDSCDT